MLIYLYITKLVKPRSLYLLVPIKQHQYSMLTAGIEVFKSEFRRNTFNICPKMTVLTD